MANRRDDYMNKRSWLIDTAETPADKKKLKSDLAKLDKKFNPNRVASTSKTAGIKATKKQVEKVRAVANLVAPFAPAKKAVERTVGKAKLAAGMGTTKKKMTQTKTPMKPGTNPKIGAKPAIKKVGKK